MPRSRKYDGVVYRRKEAPFWWIRYRDRSGARRRESTFTQDWQEAQRLLRERLQARDNNALDVIRKGEKLSLGQWADFFLENYSKQVLVNVTSNPPFPACSTGFYSQYCWNNTYAINLNYNITPGPQAYWVNVNQTFTGIAIGAKRVPA